MGIKHACPYSSYEDVVKIKWDHLGTGPPSKAEEYNRDGAVFTMNHTSPMEKQTPSAASE